MIKELDKQLLKLKLTIAGHLSNMKIKHENLEGKYISLVADVDKLEERIRTVETNLSSIVFKAVRNTLLTLAGGATSVYTILKIIEWAG